MNSLKIYKTSQFYQDPDPKDQTSKPFIIKSYPIKAVGITLDLEKPKESFDLKTDLLELITEY